MLQNLKHKMDDPIKVLFLNLEKKQTFANCSSKEMVRYYSPPPFDLRPLEAWGPSIIIEDIGASTSQTFQTNVFLHCPCVSNLCVSALSGPCVTQGLVLSQVVTMGTLDRIYWRAITTRLQPFNRHA